MAADPTLEGIWVQFGHALKESGHRPAAEHAYRQALAIDPANADTHLQLGHLLKIDGRPEPAIHCYARAAELDPGLADARIELDRLTMLQAGTQAGPARDTLRGPAKLIRNLIIGTMGLCNASCIHCPTGKPETAHAPRTPMPMFRALIDEIARNGYRIAGQVSFGLFGDGLLDPFVVERAHYLRDRLPEARLSINTNGAAYDRVRHAPLRATASIIALHVESLNPAVYSALMQPLRPRRVFPKFEELLADFGKQIAISVPVSRLNRAELPAMREYFLAHGAGYVNFDRLSSRCSEDRSIYDALAISPERGMCSSAALNDLVIDCDGLVLMCCNDFRRLEPVGQLGAESLIEVIFGERRADHARRLDAGDSSSFKSCSVCYGDLPVEGCHS